MEYSTLIEYGVRTRLMEYRYDTLVDQAPISLSSHLSENSKEVQGCCSLCDDRDKNVYICMYNPEHDQIMIVQGLNKRSVVAYIQCCYSILFDVTISSTTHTQILCFISYFYNQE